MKYVLAVDLGGTKTATALVDENGLIRERKKRPASRTVKASAAQIALAMRDEISAVGIIVPGIYDHATGRAWCPNLWGQDEVALREELDLLLRVPVFLDSDRSGYVLGESWTGAARGLLDVAFVSVGTGIGVGILSAGRVLHGAHGIAGAAGWMSLDPDWQPGYGVCGNWEALAAGPAVARAFDVEQAEEVVAAAEAGDARAQQVLRQAAVATGRGVSNLISILNPEMVVLGGGLLQGAESWMIEAIRCEALRWAQPTSARKCRIEMTQLGEDAGLLGAARLAHLAM
jgi:glucokinase